MDLLILVFLHFCCFSSVSSCPLSAICHFDVMCSHSPYFLLSSSVFLSLNLSFFILASEIIYIGPMKGKLSSSSVLFSSALLSHPRLPQLPTIHLPSQLEC